MTVMGKDIKTYSQVVQPFRITAECPHCNTGELLVMSPITPIPQCMNKDDVYSHACNHCGGIVFLDKEHPRIVYSDRGRKISENEMSAGGANV